MKDTILILTNTRDESVEPVLAHLRSMNQPFVRFDTENFPKNDVMTLMGNGDEIFGTLTCSGIAVDIDSIKSVWWRRPMDSSIQDDIHPGYMQFISDESKIALRSFYSLLSEAFWMNNPIVSTRLIEHNKLYQLKIASRLGLKTPRTLVTNDPNQILDFIHREDGSAAIKILRGNFFSRENDDQHLFIFTKRISEDVVREHFSEFRMAPVMVQEYIPKSIELRVTVIGEKVFACAIHSQASERTQDDWRRYDFDNVKHEPYLLPDEIQEKLVALVRYWGLTYGACDLILTPEGEYVFLEINANGQWYWIEQLTQMPISKTIAETLTEAPMHLMKFSF